MIKLHEQKFDYYNYGEYGAIETYFKIFKDHQNFMITRIYKNTCMKCNSKKELKRDVGKYVDLNS